MQCQFDGNRCAETLLILAHGAGAGMAHPFMQALTKRLASDSLCVLRFNFDYMQTMLETGRRRPPERMPALVEQYRQALQIELQNFKSIFIAGKSMGGRVATLLAQNELPAAVKGVLVYGFPFFPARKSEPFKGEHLARVSLPHLICQGERDPMGSRARVESLPLDASIQLQWISDGDHGFVPRKSSGVSLAQNLDTAASISIAFINNLR